MDEVDDVSEEERVLAEKLAAHLDGELVPDASFEELAAPLALLLNFEHFSMNEEARARGRSEVDNRAKAPAANPRPEKSEKTARKWRFLYWVPVPSVAALILALELTGGPGEEALETKTPPPGVAATGQPHPDPEKDEAGFEPALPRYHIGETPRALLSAQAAVLAQREPGQAKEEARHEFERQMRAYRGQLIASLEVGGR